MKSYIKYQDEIKQFRDITETVRTIEKISGAYVKLVQDRKDILVEFTEGLRTIISRISDDSDLIDNNYFISHGSNKALIIFSGNKGLIGKIYNKLSQTIVENKNKYTRFISIGEIAKKVLLENVLRPEEHLESIEDIPSTDEISNWFEKVLATFNVENYDVDILSPVSDSFTETHVEINQFLPFKLDISTTEAIDEYGFPIFEPNKGNLLNYLISEYLEIMFNRIIIDAKLSEFSTRAILTENASEKAEELTKKTIRQYFKDRKKLVTQKQLESFTVHVNKQ